MKFVIYTLLLANLGFFVWHYRPGDSGLPVLQPLSGPRLLRYGEVVEPTPTVTAAGQCVTLGPVAKQKLADELRVLLAESGIQAETRMTRDTSRKGYWVYLAPARNRQAARETVQALKAAGVEDYFVVVTGAQKNAISLGVFSRADLAKRRLKTMKKKGFPAKIDRVPLPRREYWLDWPVTDASALSADRLEQLSEIAPGLGQIQQACP